MTWQQPTRKDPDTFRRVEEWNPVRCGAWADRNSPRHLRTRPSRRADLANPDLASGGSGQLRQKHVESYPAGSARSRQGDLWACVQDGIKPDRGVPTPPAEALPADLTRHRQARSGNAADGLVNAESIVDDPSDLLQDLSDLHRDRAGHAWSRLRSFWRFHSPNP